MIFVFPLQRNGFYIMSKPTYYQLLSDIPEAFKESCRELKATIEETEHYFVISI